MKRQNTTLMLHFTIAHPFPNIESKMFVCGFVNSSLKYICNFWADIFECLLDISIVE